MSKIYDDEEKTFPKRNTVVLCIIAFLQVVLLGVGTFYSPPTQDVIDYYEIVVEPNGDGTLDIRYSFVWTPIDKTEALTWAKIGVANKHFSVYRFASSDNIQEPYFYSDRDGIFARIDFTEPHRAGEMFRFSYKIRQSQMLCSDGNGKFYDFVPGWFNKIPVTEYRFLWKNNEDIVSSNCDKTSDGWLEWSGDLKCGKYVEMRVDYSSTSFNGAPTVDHVDFSTSNAYDATKDDKSDFYWLIAMLIAAGFIIEIIILDSYVSYSNGRGFIVRYGYHMHKNGRVNPLYREAAEMHRQTRSGGHGGGGGSCACACACACAGGGRAGCSQKDTYVPKEVADN